MEGVQDKENFRLDSFVHNCTLVFKLMKEKKMFENLYRRMLVERITRHYSHYDIAREQTLILAMEKECGNEWVQKI